MSARPRLLTLHSQGIKAKVASVQNQIYPSYSSLTCALCFRKMGLVVGYIINIGNCSLPGWKETQQHPLLQWYETTNLELLSFQVSRPPPRASLTFNSSLPQQISFHKTWLKWHIFWNLSNKYDHWPWLKRGSFGLTLDASSSST